MSEKLFPIIQEYDPRFLKKQHYYIDLPCDVEMAPPQVRRIEIPRVLAFHLESLRKEVSTLRQKLGKDDE